VLFMPWAAVSGWALEPGRPWPALLLPGFCWAAIEFGMSHGTFAFPWWSLAVTQVDNPLVSQLPAWTGMYGISFFVVTANVLVLKIIERELPAQRRFWIAMAAVFAVAVAAGLTNYLRKPAGCGIPERVALVQANYTQEEKEDAVKRGVDINEMYRTYWDMTRQAATTAGGADLVVWPESVLPIEFLTHRYYWPVTKDYIDNFAITLVAGVYEGAHNSVITIVPKLGVVGQYNKMQLVPFGEFVPYRKELGFTPGLRKWIDEKIYPEDVQAGTKFVVFHTGRADFGALICFESMPPGNARRMTRDGARMLFVVTNDAWFLKSPAAAQHVALARLRAIENSRWLAQAANSGISTIIDPRGRVMQSSKIFRRTIVRGTMLPCGEMTFYTRFGDVFGWLCAAGLVICFVFVLMSQRKNTN
jgi:apolipoprotein N-acyltransferase